MDQVQLQVNGQQVEVADAGITLLDALRDHLGITSPKDGCSPQGQCGCCTVLVDGKPRVACVTPLRRVRGREVTTIEGLPGGDRAAWAEAFCATGGSQCGFCTPGIVLRLEGLRRQQVAAGGRAVVDGRDKVDQALLAHLCRCTGWQTIGEAYDVRTGAAAAPVAGRDLDAASRRATIEGGVDQRVDPAVPLGEGGFAADTAPAGALVAVRSSGGDWVVGETLAEARAAAGKVQGRRTTMDLRWPVEVPPGDWAATLQTTWTEPAYLETDASWCRPGGDPWSPLANGGAFGGKHSSEAPAAARRLADEHGRPVLVLFSREDSVQLGPKRPPLGGGLRADGTGALRVVRTTGIAEALRRVLPEVEVEEIDVAGPPTSAALRGAGWAEAEALRAAVLGVRPVESPQGAVAEAEVADGLVRIAVRCGEPLDEVTLRSYCIGAAHMALSWVRSEGIAVDDAGRVHDLSIRSFGVLRSVDMPPVEVEVLPDHGPPVNGSDAVFVAVAAAAHLAAGAPPRWPSRTGGGEVDVEL